MGTFEEKGIYVGLVGARFEKPNLMEWQNILVTREQNVPENGYGLETSTKNKLLEIWSSFYGIKFLTFEEAETDSTGRFIRLSPKIYFDSSAYKERIKMTIEPFLLHANQCGIEGSKKVYCHIVGLGLSVWLKSPIQAKLMLEVYADLYKIIFIKYFGSRF